MWSRLLAFLLLLASVLPLQAQVPGSPYRRVLVWLAGEPLADYHARMRPPLPGLYEPLRLGTSEMEAHGARLAAGRLAVRQRLEQLGFLADGETDVVLHTLIGRLPEENLEAAGAIPGVLEVRPVRTYRPLLDAAVPLIKANAAWVGLGGEERAGRGARIAIIDSGIDVSHPMLQDPRLELPAGFPKGEREFTNSKVIVARNYLALLGDPRDPPDAMDREGHGTFVAAIAAGRRALAPYGEVVGVAPAAQLGSYRIFGSPLGLGQTTDAVVIAAINDAVSDGMNVINLSIGGSFLDLPSEEPVPKAVEAATRAGVAVVAAAGNEGDELATISEPANSQAAIAVGASNNARVFANPLRVLGAASIPDRLQRLGAVPALSVTVSQVIGPAPLLRPVGNGCRALVPPEDARSKIAIVDDGSCSSSTKARYLADAGTLAAVIYRRDDEDPAAVVLTAPPLPVFQLSREDGEALANFLAATPGLQAAIDPGIRAFPVTPDRIPAYSSRGPSNDMELKPDLVAPGTAIYSAVQINDALGILYSPTQFGVSEGTSFSTAFVSGAVALLKQTHPTWSPAQLRSAVVNSALATATEGGKSAAILACGAGRLEVERALKASAVFEPVGLSFGASLLREPVKVERALRITNLSSNAESYAIEVVPQSNLAGASVTIEPAATEPVSPGGSATVRATFRGPSGVAGKASTDGRLRVRALGTGVEYLLPYWARVVDASELSYLFRIRGNGQTATISSVLPRPLAVQVMDSDYLGVAGVTVRFEIVYGSGALSASQVVTDFAGVAAVTLRLSDRPGAVQVRASAFGTLTRTFTATARPAPVTSAASVVHAASFSRTVAPGSIISIFGTGLAGGTAAAGSVPLPRELASAQVLFSGQPAPLLYASPTQINAQVPFELAGAPSAELRVSVLGVPSPAVVVPLVAAAPGVFTVSSDGRGAAVALHADFSSVTAASPARPGEIVALFATGLGAVTPAVPSGTAAPSSPPATTTAVPAVQLGSAAARVRFSGLAPGFVGLYQVNFEVPTGVAGDAVPLILALGGNTSNTVSLAVR